MELNLLYEGGNYLTSPVLVDDKLYVISNNTGEILEINLANPKTATIWANSGGQPTGAAYDPSGGFYVTDFAHKSLLYLDPKGENRRVCSECEGRHFIGPSSVARSKSGNLLFTDSGPAGATSVINPNGAIYQLAWSMNNFILVPVIDKGLACPCGIAFSKTEKYMYKILLIYIIIINRYVCEFLANRILRLVEDPPCVYQPSVFYTFNGRMGPKSICISHLKNYLFVGHFDYPSEGI